MTSVKRYVSILPITSLADLTFKASTDERYQQLAILGCRSLDCFGVRTFEHAMEKLHCMGNLQNGCKFMLPYINENCNKILVTRKSKIKAKSPSVSTLIKKKQAH